MIKVGLLLFMSKTHMFVAYVGDCLFWAQSQSGIGKSMNYLK